MANQINIKDAKAKNYVLPVVPHDARVRLEIDELLGDNDMMNLYLLAMEAMQQEHSERSVANGNEDWWTFNSLAGIHNQPEEEWDGVVNKAAPGWGYCAHGETVFPTWHRVYMGMFEQAVLNKMQDIAGQYSVQEEKIVYQNAVDKFRLPYWDPFLPRNKLEKLTDPKENVWGIPDILAVKNVWVKRPNPYGAAEIESTPNPLYQFTFPSQDVIEKKQRKSIKFGVGFEKYGHDHTLRTPGPTGETNIYDDGPEKREGLNLRIRRQATNLSTKLWKLLSRYNTDIPGYTNEIRTWESFANHLVSDPRTRSHEVDEKGKRLDTADTSISLESWHDDIHLLVGTGNGSKGHMASSGVAAFDPIFWLHHCNIDRIFAIYQALYPKKWVSASGKPNASTRLYPFRKDANEFWNSNDVKDWTTLGFAIPGNQRLNKENITTVETYLHDYYNWATVGATAPPQSVADYWPKHLCSSFALYGSEATNPEHEYSSQCEELRPSKRVTGDVKWHVTETPDAQVVNEPEIRTVQDSTFKYPKSTIQDGKLLTWNARISVRKFAFNGSFNIHVFIGHVDDDQPRRFITKKNEVGFSGIFASSANAPCANCIQQREDDVFYEDAIPITTALLAYLKTDKADEAEGPLRTFPERTLRTLESFKPDHVVPFLKEHMRWRLTDAASNPINNDQDLLASKLEVAVSVRGFELPSTEKPLGEYYPPQVYEEITKDKVGGFGYGSGTAQEL